MDLQVFLNSKFAASLGVALPFAIPVSILAIKMNKENVADAFNRLIDCFKVKPASKKKDD